MGPTDNKVLKNISFFYTDVHEGSDIHRYNVDAVKLNGHRGTSHYHQKNSLDVVVELRPVDSEDYIRNLETLRKNETLRQVYVNRLVFLSIYYANEPSS